MDDSNGLQSINRVDFPAQTFWFNDVYENFNPPYKVNRSELNDN